MKMKQRNNVVRYMNQINKNSKHKVKKGKGSYTRKAKYKSY